MKRHKTLISGVTDFAHLNDYIFLANFKLENLLYTRDFDRSFISKIRVLFSSLSTNLDSKSRFPNLVQLWLKEPRSRKA